MAISRTQIDRLGERLKAGTVREHDLRELDEYRRSFGAAYDHVRAVILEGLGFAATGRPAKTTSSIVEKLRRESIRLTQVQDIAGCRLVVLTPNNQDAAVASLKGLFPDADVVDRRRQPSHGYRAVHVVATIDGKLIEIQVRTVLQHLWAHVSERCSDVLDPRIKYGGGPESVVRFLADESLRIASLETDLADESLRASAGQEWGSLVLRLVDLAADPLRLQE